MTTLRTPASGKDKLTEESYSQDHFVDENVSTFIGRILFISRDSGYALGFERDRCNSVEVMNERQQANLFFTITVLVLIDMV